MNKFASLVLGGIVASLSAIATAQPAIPQAVDCAKARNPERCEARQKARTACLDKRGPERRQCIKEHMPPPAPAPARRNGTGG